MKRLAESVPNLSISVMSTQVPALLNMITVLYDYNTFQTVCYL